MRSSPTVALLLQWTPDKWGPVKSDWWATTERSKNHGKKNEMKFSRVKLRYIMPNGEDVAQWFKK